MKKIKILNLILALIFFSVCDAQWITNGTSIYNSNSGNVGIGTTSPQTVLHMQNNIGNGWLQTIKGAAYNVGDIVGIKFKSGYNGEESWDIKSTGIASVVESAAGNTNGLAFYTDYDIAYERMRINANGNVGIGTPIPNAKLHVIGAYSGGSGDMTNITNAQLRIESSAGYIRIPHISADAGISIVHNYQTNKSVYWGESSDVGNYYFRGRNILVTEGKVGIGTATPTAQLHLADIYGAGGQNLLIGDDAYLTDIDQTNILGIYGNVNSDRAGVKLGSNGPTLFGLNGNLGIGTTNPISQLQIQSSANIATKVNIGSTPNGNNLSYSVGFIGFNAARKNDNTWSIDSDGTHNGGTAIFGDIFGYLRFASISSKWDGTGNQNRTFTDNDILNNTAMMITDGKNVIIGNGQHLPSATDFRLAVDGYIYGKKVVVTNSWSDYVFEKEYKKMDLNVLEDFVSKNKHLPNIPIACEIEDNGIDMGEMLKLQMAKIEELTLYVIDLNKEIKALKKLNK